MQPKHLPTTDPRPDCKSANYRFAGKQIGLPHHRCSEACDWTLAEATAFVKTQRVHIPSMPANRTETGKTDSLKPDGIVLAHSFVMEYHQR